MVDWLTEQDKAELREAFTILDKDNDGIITTTEYC